MSETHHLYSPSALKRRLLCPGSARMERGKPDTPSEDAKEGTMLHAVCAAIIAQGKRVNDFPELTAEQIETVVTAVSMWSHFLATYNGHFLASERKVFCRNRSGGVLCDGTLDLLGTDFRGTAILADFKFGRDPVDATADNWQLGAYALGVHDTFPDFERVVAMPIQPRIPWNLRQEPYAFTHFEDIRTNIERVIADCEKPDALLIPGTEQCRYCKGYEECPAVRELAGKQIELVAAKECLPCPADMSDYQLSEFTRKWRFLGRFASEVEAELRRRCEEGGGQCGGYRLKPGRKDRKIADLPAAFAALNREHGVSPEQFMACCKVGFGELDTLLCKASGLSLAKAKARLAELLGDNLEVVEQRPSLAEVEG